MGRPAMLQRDGLPPPETVARHAPLVVGGLLAVITALAGDSLLEKAISDEERSRRATELRRRAERLMEVIRALENTFEEEPPRGKDGEPPPLESLGQIKFETVLQRCRELEQLNTPESGTGQLLQQGLQWGCRVLKKELRVATCRTKHGQDVEYSDGSKLDKLLRQPDNLERVARRAGYPVPPDALAELHAQAAEGQAVRTAQKRAYIRKAFLLLMRARATWPWVAANSLVAVVSGVLHAVALDYQAQMLETFRLDPSTARGQFRSVALAWMMVQLCSTLLSVVGAQLSARGEKMASRLLQVQLFRAVARQELHWWEVKAESDVHALDRLVRHSLPVEVSRVLNIPRDFLRRIASIIAAAWRMRQQSSFLLYWMVAIHWTSVLAQKGIRRLKEELQHRAYRGIILSSQDDETFRYALRPEYATLYQSFVRGPKEAKLFEQAVLNHQRYEQRMSTIAQLVDPAGKVVGHASTISQFAAVGDLVEQGRASDGQARALMHHAHEVTREIEGTYSDWMNAQSKCSELAKAYDLITLAPRIDPDGGEVPEGRARGHIAFRDVHFEYPNRKGVVLQGTTFEVEPGQVVGIVGTTGCGKSTLFKILQRFYDVTGGSIQLDDRDLRELNPEWLRSQIATVSQEPDLIPLTIRDNICIGCAHEPSVEEVEAACRAANIWEALSDKTKFPEGLQTRMRAVKNIAGGEKQRICIARAILANPPILLLDEATSALDKVTENMVQEALETLMQGRTTLVIAHRLSTICKADKILGMKDGRIVEAGTHEELLRKSPDDPTCVYGRFWREQDGAVPDASLAAAPASGSTAGPPDGGSGGAQAQLQSRLSRLRGVLKEASKGKGMDGVRRATMELVAQLEEEVAHLARERALLEVERRRLREPGAGAEEADGVQATGEPAPPAAGGAGGAAEEEVVPGPALVAAPAAPEAAAAEGEPASAALPPPSAAAAPTAADAAA